MQATFDELQQAFVDGRITLEQLIEVLVDNFGIEKTCQIITHNLMLAMQKEQHE